MTQAIWLLVLFSTIGFQSPQAQAMACRAAGAAPSLEAQRTIKQRNIHAYLRNASTDPRSVDEHFGLDIVNKSSQPASVHETYLFSSELGLSLPGRLSLTEYNARVSQTPTELKLDIFTGSELHPSGSLELAEVSSAPTLRQLEQAVPTNRQEMKRRSQDLISRLARQGIVLPKNAISFSTGVLQVDLSEKTQTSIKNLSEGQLFASYGIQRIKKYGRLEDGIPEPHDVEVVVQIHVDLDLVAPENVVAVLRAAPSAFMRNP